MAAETQGATVYNFGIDAVFSPAGTTTVEFQSSTLTKTPNLVVTTANESGVVTHERDDDVTLELTAVFQADVIPTDSLGDAISPTAGAITAPMLLVRKTQAYAQDQPAVFTYVLRKRSAITHS